MNLLDIIYTHEPFFVIEYISIPYKDRRSLVLEDIPARRDDGSGHLGAWQRN